MMFCRRPGREIAVAEGVMNIPCNEVEMELKLELELEMEMEMEQNGRTAKVGTQCSAVQYSRSMQDQSRDGFNCPVKPERGEIGLVGGDGRKRAAKLGRWADASDTGTILLLKLSAASSRSPWPPERHQVEYYKKSSIPISTPHASHNVSNRGQELGLPWGPDGDGPDILPYSALGARQSEAQRASHVSPALCWRQSHVSCPWGGTFNNLGTATIFHQPVAWEALSCKPCDRFVRPSRIRLHTQTSLAPAQDPGTGRGAVCQEGRTPAVGQDVKKKISLLRDSRTP
jgi:hypothetical protein